VSNSAKFLYFLVKQQMKEQENMQDSFEVFRQNLQNFIDISLMEDETSWMDCQCFPQNRCEMLGGKRMRQRAMSGIQEHLRPVLDNSRNNASRRSPMQFR
jgi:hypothetical protein